VACNSYNKKTNQKQFQHDSAMVMQLIKKGDSIYTQKANYSTFSKSGDLYDAAWQIAQQTADNNLLATAIYAKGRAYDAMNSNPQKTIDYYSQAAALFGTMPDKKIKALYIKHLVAHGYDKVRDSSNCLKILKELYNEILPLPDSIKKEMRFTVEMGLISSVVKNYTFADSILQHLTRREWIVNDPTEYDYLNHYLLAKAKISVLQHRQYNSPYIDSLENIFATSRNLNDSMFFSNELWELYKAMGNKTKENFFLNLNTAVFNKFNTPESVREAKDKMAKMEVAAVEASRKAENEKAENRKWFIYILSALLATISVLAFFLLKRNNDVRRKNIEAEQINKQLNQKNLQNELLNKEIHHRVKNNLQMIMSLVHLQENNTNTEEVKENMLSIRLRIESIAKLHQQLMEQSDMVDLKKYIQYIVSNSANLIADNKKIITHLDIETLQVPQKISFPLGLIINEWVTNSVKYAQPLSGVLEITVHISKESDNLKVYFDDNGQPQTERLPKKSLGLEIAGILTEQMDGNIETTDSKPYHYKLTIPLTDG
jgi:two-component sensor histidine kinase